MSDTDTDTDTIGTVPEYYTYGDSYKVLRADLPESSNFNLGQTGTNHKMGNETAAKVTARIRTTLAESRKVAAKEISQSDIAVYRAANIPTVDAWTKEFRDEMWNDIVNGTLGTREGGPRGPVDPVGKLAMSLVESDVMTRLAGYNAKQTANGKPTVKLTQKDLAEKCKTVYDANKDHWRAQAEKQMARAAKQQDAADDALFA